MSTTEETAATEATPATEQQPEPEPEQAEPEPEQAEPEPLLAPGSEAARAAGCRCPAWINAFGAGVRTGCGTLDEGSYLAHPACRLHGSEAVA